MIRPEWAQRIRDGLRAGILRPRESLASIVMLESTKRDRNLIEIRIPVTYLGNWSCGQTETPIAHEIEHLIQAKLGSGNPPTRVEQLSYVRSMERDALDTEFGYYLEHCPVGTGSLELRDLARFESAGRDARVRRLQNARILRADIHARLSNLQLGDPRRLRDDFRKLVQLLDGIHKNALSVRDEAGLTESYSTIRTVNRVLPDSVDPVPETVRKLQDLEFNRDLEPGGAREVWERLEPKYNQLVMALQADQSRVWRQLVAAADGA
ncbi:MAG: hypothetical protein V1798_09190 [Pseudomonadota bacterium]